MRAAIVTRPRPANVDAGLHNPAILDPQWRRTLAPHSTTRGEPMKGTTLIWIAALAASGALAQSPEGNRPRMPMKPDFAAALGITPEKAAQVEAVMQRERDAMRKVHDAARAELATILTAAELARLEELRPPRPGPGGPPPGAPRY
jgi:hypothetical protein